MFCRFDDLNALPASFSAIDPAATVAGHGPVYRSTDATAEAPKLMTLVDSLERSVASFPDHPFLGHRPLDAAGDAGPYEWQTYRQCHTRIQHIAAGLLAEQLLAPTVDDQRFLGIYMKNRPEWVLAQYSAFYAGAAIVPIYDTLGAAATTFVLNQTLVATVVCTTAEIDSLFAKASASPSLRHIILCDVATVDATLQATASELNLRVSTLADIEAAGVRKATLAPAALSVDDMCVLMYTSGTTGNPKGAMISHGNMDAVRHGIIQRLSSNAPVAAMLHNRSSVLSFLPLAHVAEQSLHAAMIFLGGAIGFYQGNALKLVDDVQALRPTLFLAVPRLLNKIYDKITEGAAAAGGIKAWLFQTALDAKLSNLKRGVATHSVYDALIFSKLKAKLGFDRCQLLVTGAAPLPAHVLTFYRALLGCACFELYGQTEATGATTMTDPLERDAGTVGPPLVSCDIKLVSVPDMGYNVTDTTHG
ncbi:Long-chain-fatty-acid--CoA ligase, partial [Achlya hypogyna]